MLYLEGSTDLAILHAFARRLRHEGALRALERPFIKYVQNKPGVVRDHYYGLREAVPELRGVVVFDRLEREPSDMGLVVCLTWSRREIENYLCSNATLEAYAKASAIEAAAGPLFQDEEAARRLGAMRESIDEVVSALETLGKGSPWGPDIKASDDFLRPLFEAYFRKLGLPNVMAKKNFYELADYVPDAEIDLEISEKLDAIVRVAKSSAPPESPA